MSATNPPTATMETANAAALAEKRAAVFDRLSHMFRRAGSEVTTQALFRAMMEYGVEREENDA